MTTAFSSPILYDKPAQEINTLLASTFDDQYPVCFTGEEEEETFPVVYENDGTRVNFRVMPNNTRSLSFFTIEGELVEQEEYHLVAPMAITCWVNLEDYNTSSDYNFDYTTEIIRDVYNVLRGYGCYDLSINVNDPFEGFSMLQARTHMMRPYSGFKISFNKIIRVCTT
ncbi:unnamed protein product [marine sediment metagenome]|uniref:Uncharacterized protein n=1 Tax=marine sediment metagenome TaxID=412755 RepID=X0TAS4_9ZZZZ